MTSIIQKVPQLLFGLGSTPNANITTTTTPTKQDEDYYVDDVVSSGTATPPPPYEKSVMTKRAAPDASLQREQDTTTTTMTTTTTTNNPAMINTTLVGQSMTLIQIAAEMQSSRQMTMALDLYMVALDKMMAALPLDTDPNAKRMLRDKLKVIKERYDLDHDEEDAEVSNISESVIHAAIACAVALKKSPIPDMMASAMSYAVSSINTIDKMLCVRERTWQLVSCGVAKLTQVDRHYQLHQMVAGAVYTSAMAIFKAGIAYTETPGYSETKEHKRL